MKRRDFIKISSAIVGGLIINQMSCKKEKQTFYGGISNIEKYVLKGSLHSHGCWTDYRNKDEQKEFPFDLKTFAKYCISCGRDFQAITDIMAARPGKPEFIEKRYDALLDTANPNDKDYELQKGKSESTIFFKNGSKLIIPRTQEVLSDINYKHILAIGIEKDIKGGRNSLDILKEINGLGGYSILDHTFMCNAWNEDEIMNLYDEGLVRATEWNGGLTFPELCKFLPVNTPNKESNRRVISLEKKYGIPCIANDDSHCVSDIKRGAFTSYTYWGNLSFIEKIVNSIKNRNFKRHEHYSSLLSPLKHVKYGSESQKTFGEKGLPDA